MTFITKSEDDPKANKKLKHMVNDFIGFSGKIMKIFSFTGGVHSSTSSHYDGKACDLGIAGENATRIALKEEFETLSNNFQELVYKKDKTFFELAILAYVFGFKRLGIYPHWSKKGFHLDISTKKDGKQTPCVWTGLSTDILEKKVKEARKNKSSQIYIYF